MLQHISIFGFFLWQHVLFYGYVFIDCGHLGFYFGVFWLVLLGAVVQLLCVHALISLVCTSLGCSC